jgi:transaldolase
VKIAPPLFAPRRNDGFVSLELSPLLANDTKGSVAAAASLHKKANRPNLFIKIPGTKEGNPAIEESIAAGVAIIVYGPTIGACLGSVSIVLRT